jgi:hypothetical protein
VAYLGAKSGANIVIGNDLSQVKIGDLQLRDAPVDLALQALSVASGNTFVVRYRLSSLGPSRALYMLEATPDLPTKSAPTVQAFNLSGYLHYIKHRWNPDPNKWTDVFNMNIDRLFRSKNGPTLKSRRLLSSPPSWNSFPRQSCSSS